MKRLLLLISVLLQIQSMQASHVAGAELTYQCLGNGNYQVTFTFYRDCFGIPPPTSVLVTISNSCGIPDSNATLTMANAPVIINPGCSQNSTCMGGTLEGIQKCIYTGVITLPSACSSWSLGVSMSTRSPGLGGIQNPDSYNLYVGADINNMNNLCNNSPVFEIDPVVNVCINQSYCLNPGGHDIDGDSLVYSFTPPLSAPNTPITYYPPLTYNQPLISNPPVTINSTNGEICFTPTQPIATCYAILIQEYRNGVIIGQVVRDIVLYSMSCNAQSPSLTGMNGLNIYNESICAYYQTCFNIYSYDPNASDSTTITWDNSIAGASFVTSTAQYDSAVFCWAPGQSDIDTIPHCFTVYVKDNSCPAFQTSSKTFCITVHDTTAICSPVSVNNMNFLDQKLLIYPQPSANHINIDCGIELNGRNNYFLTITDIFSKVMYQSKIIDKITELNTDNLFSDGVYFATIKDEKGILISKAKFIIAGKK